MPLAATCLASVGIKNVSLAPYRLQIHGIGRIGGGGSLVVTSSLAAISGQARGQHYAATKGGVISMMKALAVELGRQGVRANAILPGWIETDMTADAIGNEKFAANVLPRIPMRRWGTGADFGGIAVYLMSSASAYHTGDTFLIDGGYALF